MSISDGRSYVKLFRSVYSNQSWHAPIARGDHLTYENDILFLNGLNSWPVNFVSGPLAVSDIIGIPRSDFETKWVGRHLTPRPENYMWNKADDFARYGSILAIPSLGGEDEPLAMLHEKSVSHVRYRGEVSDSRFVEKYYKPGGLAYKRGTFIGQDSYLKSPWVSRADSFQMTGTNSNGFMVFEERAIGTYFEDRCVDAYEQILYNISLINSMPVAFYWWPLFFEYSNAVNNGCKFVDNIYHIDVAYDFTVRALPFYPWNGTFAKFHVNLKFDLGWHAVYGTRRAQEINTVHPDVCVLTQASTVELVEKHHEVHTVDNDGWRLISEPFDWPSTQILQTGPNFGYYFDEFRRNGGRSTLHRSSTFARIVNAQMNQIRPSHFLASSDALTKHIEVLKANNLENLAQLGQILEILPDLSKFSHLIARAMKGDIGAIKELIDLIANEILKYKFSTKPTSGDASEILNTDIKKMLESITSVKRATLYGHFSYVFTDEENFMKDGRLTLTTRSKVRTYFDMSTLMVAYLTANSVGLLPTLERAWALLPFSFVIDWFTNMSKRLHLVDNQLLYATVRVPWALHSYSVTYYPSDNALNEFNLVNVDPEKPFGLSMYIREFTRYTPKLGESKFDFLRPTRGPDPVTVGALVWQYLF